MYLLMVKKWSNWQVLKKSVPYQNGRVHRINGEMFLYETFLGVIWIVTNNLFQCNTGNGERQVGYCAGGKYNKITESEVALY